MTAVPSSPRWFHWNGDALYLELRVQPRFSRDEVCGVQAGRLRLRIQAPPVEGRANAHLLTWLAREFRVAQIHVHLLAGERGRDKTVRIDRPRQLPDWFRELTAGEIDQH